MSRYIDHDKPLSEEDIEYLKTRPGGDYLIEVNEARFGELDDEGRAEVVQQVDEDDEHDLKELEELDEDGDGVPDFDEDVIDRVAPLDFTQLRAAATKLKLGGDGTKEELQDKLLNYYQDLKESDAEKAKPETVLD